MAASWVRNDCPQTDLASRSQEPHTTCGQQLCTTHPSRNPSVGHRARMVGPTRGGPPAQPVGETHVGLACPVPLGSSQFAYSLALCILPHPRPSAGTSTLPKGTVPLQHRFSRSHPRATFPPTHQHPPQTVHYPAPTLSLPEKAAKPGPRPYSCPPSPPTSGHALAGEDLALQPLVHTPRSSTLSHLSPLPRCAPC